MNGSGKPETKFDYVTMPFDKAGRYRLIFKFATIPYGQTLIALLCNDRAVPVFDFVPLSKTAIVDITITGDKPVLVASHPALISVAMAGPAYNPLSRVSYGNSMGRLAKKALKWGQIIRIRAATPGFSYFISSRALKERQLNAIWRVWTARLLEKVAVDIKNRRIMARKSTPRRTCIFVQAKNFIDVENAFKLRNSVDHIVLAISDPQLADIVLRDHEQQVSIFMISESEQFDIAFLKAIQANVFEGYDLVGVPPELSHVENGISADWKHSFDNPAALETALLFGSKAIVDGIANVFEANPKVGIVRSPYRELFGQIQRSLSITRTITPRFECGGGWYRVEACSALQSLDMEGFATDFCKSNDPAEWCPAIDKHLARAGFELSNKLFANPRDGEPAIAAEFKVIRQLPSPKHKKVCLFVGFAANGEMRPHAYHFMRELRRAGYLVYALAANGAEDLKMHDPGADICDGLAARENIGYDFALWSAAMQNDRRLFDADELLWVNDSLIGPLVPLDDIMKRIESLTSDVVGLVDSYQHKYHCQSFFLCMRKSAITSTVFEEFVRDMRSYIDKTDVINKYELEFYSRMVAGGLNFDIVFRCDRLGFAKHKNATVQYWRELLGVGFPFIKAQIVRDNPLFDDLSDMKSLVARYEDVGFGEAAFSGFGAIPDVAR